MSNPNEKTHHVPVFLDAVLEVLRSLSLQPKNIFDGTFGRGGHTSAFLNEWPESKLVAFDWDMQAIRFGQDKFAGEIASARLKLVHSSYSEFAKLRSELRAFDLMLLDLGVSSPQLDQADRGFSFYHDGPLDMRMDQGGALKASDIVNDWDEQDLARLFIEYGEVQRPFRVARAIVNDRKVLKPYETTRELASLIERVDGWQKKGSHPATRYFLALRLKVNEELTNLERSLPELIQGLAPGGILAVITFHSLEDRIVKNVFKNQLEHGELVNRKVIKPTDDEVKSNPRARSAKLRLFQKDNGPKKTGQKYPKDQA